jgi:oligopeptide/dipeptide ABC transporter ATP-binding protein
MYLGTIVEMTAYRDIYTSPKHPYTQALLSAVPVPDLNAKSERIILGGDVPSPINPPSGCRFHPRCPKCMQDICPRQEPQLKNLGQDHWVACHLY